MLSTIEKVVILKTVGLFAETPDEVLADVAGLLEEVRYSTGEGIFRKGDLGNSMYMIVSGKVRVHDDNYTLNKLGERQVFGEMALVTGQPRSASVVAVGEADVLEVNRAALGRATAVQPVIRDVLDRFTRERLIKNLLQTSPLFTPFTPAQQSDLLRRFEGHDVAAGTVVIRQGEPGVGRDQCPANGKRRTINTPEQDSPRQIPDRGLSTARIEQDIIFMAVAIEICHAGQAPADRKRWAIAATDINVVGKIPNRCLAVAGVVERVIRIPVSAKISCSC